MIDNKNIARDIFAAIKLGDADKVEAIIAPDNSRLEMITPYGTWLNFAAVIGKLEIIKRLVSLGADVNSKSPVSGGGAINQAASFGHIDIVRYLLSCGAELGVSEPERNPLFGAIQGGHTAIAKLLIDSGIDTQIKYTGESMKGMDALAFAREWGRSDIAELLISSKKE